MSGNLGNVRVQEDSDENDWVIVNVDREDGFSVRSFHSSMENVQNEKQNIPQQDEEPCQEPQVNYGQPPQEEDMYYCQACPEQPRNYIQQCQEEPRANLVQPAQNNPAQPLHDKKQNIPQQDEEPCQEPQVNYGQPPQEEDMYYCQACPEQPRNYIQQCQEEPRANLVQPAQNNPAQPLHDKWKIGSHCRAMYTADGLYYEAVITDVDYNQESCVVKFIGLFISEEKHLSSLKNTNGIEAIRAQIREAITRYVQEHPNDDDVCSSSSNTVGDNQQPEMTASPPRPIDMPQLPNETEAFYSMLNAWYWSGWYEGYYVALTRSKMSPEEDKK